MSVMLLLAVGGWSGCCLALIVRSAVDGFKCERAKAERKAEPGGIVQENPFPRFPPAPRPTPAPHSRTCLPRRRRDHG